MYAVALRHGPDRMEKCHIVVGGGDGFGAVKIDLVLSGTPLMMAAFRTDVHLFQRQHDVAADILARSMGATSI